MKFPTPAEMHILHVLWATGPCTVRVVHDALSARGVGYTTVLKTMQIMTGKGLVTRDTSRRSHVYTAQVARVPVQTGMLRQFADRVFGGSTVDLVELAVVALDDDDRADLLARLCRDA